MKVVLFCGGLGTRLREHSDTVPKSLVNVGNRPIIWHLMRYYSHFGATGASPSSTPDCTAT
jgi:glucose-1-phosphate cytidylyltransferase